MTACVNKRRALAAALAGVLALGGAAVALPAVALASGASLQSATATGAFANASVTAAVDVKGNAISSLDQIQFTADTTPKGVWPTKVQVSANAAVSIDWNFQQNTYGYDANGDAYSVTYYTADPSTGDNTGTETYSGARKGTAPSEVGKYVAVLTAVSGDYAHATLEVPFEIKAQPISGLTAYNTKSADGSFTYNGANQSGNIGLKLNGKLVGLSNFTISEIVYKTGDSAGNPGTTTSAMENAGTYSVVLIGAKGTIYEGSKTEVQVVVNKLDLSTATVVAEDQVFADYVKPATDPLLTTSNIVSINGSPDLANKVTIAFKSGPNGSNVRMDRGVYTYTVSPATAYASNFVAGKTGEYSFTCADKIVADSAFTYGFTAGDGTLNTQAMSYYGTTVPALTCDLSKGVSFSANNIRVEKSTGVYYTAGTDYTVAVTDLAGNAADASKAGWYKVTATMLSKDYTLGGSATMYVHVINGTVDQDATLYFTYNGAVVDSNAVDTYGNTIPYPVTWDGADQIARVAVSVKDSLGNALVEGTDYTVTVTDADGNVVTSASDHGVYTFTVTSDTYNFTGSTATTFVLKVNKATVNDVRLTGYTTLAGVDYWVYNGEAVVPGVEFASAYKSVTTGATSDHFEPVESGVLVPTEHYYLSGTDANGNYTYTNFAARWSGLEIKDGAVTDGSKTYVVYTKVEGTNATTTSTPVAWSTLPADAYELVYYKLNSDGSSTKVDSVEAAGTYQVFVHLANDYGNFETSKGTKGFLPASIMTVKDSSSKVFLDVDVTKWYAGYVYKAYELGYMSGYGKSGVFGPNNTLTRAEACQVLYNMAGASDYYKLSDVSPFKDVDIDEDWYAAAVLWAKEAGLVNGYGDTGLFKPDQAVTREEFVTMLARYAGKLGAEVDGDALTFNDASSVSDYAVDSVEWAVAQKLVSGYGDSNVFGPQNTITRAEVAKVITTYQSKKATTVVPGPWSTNA